MTNRHYAQDFKIKDAPLRPAFAADRTHVRYVGLAALFAATLGNRRIFGQQHLKTHLVNQSAIKRQRQGLMVLVGGALTQRWPA